MHRKSKPYQSRAKKKAGRCFIKNRRGIDERPAIVEAKSRIGDWENDCRAFNKLYVSTRVNDKSVRAVTATTIELLHPFKDQVKTITADNRKEFAYH